MSSHNNAYNKNEPLDEEEPRSVPLSFDDGAEALNVANRGSTRRFGFGTMVFTSAVVLAGVSLYSMRAIGRAGAAEPEISEAGKLVEVFLKERDGRAADGKRHADLLDTDSYARLQISTDDLAKNPFVLIGEQPSIKGATTGSSIVASNDPALAASLAKARADTWMSLVDAGAAGLHAHSVLISSKPENSMAHINGQMLHQGDSVALPDTAIIYDITKITADGVVFRAYNADLKCERLVKILVKRSS